MKNNDNIKDELRTAATIAVGATPEEDAFWSEVESYLSETPAKPSEIDVQPRELTRKRS